MKKIAMYILLSLSITLFVYSCDSAVNRESGNSDPYILQPVIRGIDQENSGAIGGTVEPADALPRVYTISGEDTLAGTQANDEGRFLMIGIPTGNYQVSVNPSANGFASAVISNIEVSAPDTTVLDTLSLETQ